MTNDTVMMLASHISHMAFNFVWRDSGVTQKHGIDLITHIANVDIPGQPFISMRERAERLLRGDYQLLSGLHHAPYTYRARGDKRFIYLAQAQNNWDDRLVAQNSIREPRELEGKTVIVSTAAPCVYGNLRRALELGGADTERINFDLWKDEEQNTDASRRAVDAVVAGKAEAAVVDVPFDLVGIKQGLREIDLPAIPVIHNTTICTNRDWVDRNEDLVDRILRSMVEAIYFFKFEADAVISILEHQLAPLLGITGSDELEHLQRYWAGILSPKPYPHPLAIWNVYQLDILHDTESNFISPMEPWDTGYLRRVDDDGFIDLLYGARDAAASPPVVAVI